MSITTTASTRRAGSSVPPPAATRRTSFARTVGVELRKLVNTRASVALVASAAILAGVFSGGGALLREGSATLSQLAMWASIPAQWVLMVLAVLLATGEFARHTASVTFTLEPRRARVLAAKATVVVLAALGVAALIVLAAVLVAAVAPLVTSNPIVWTLSPTDVGVLAGSSVFTALAGFALGLATRNAPASIVVLLVWPTVAVLAASASPVAAEVFAWIDPQPVFVIAQGAEDAWAKLATGALAWIALPGTVGAWRVLRHDL